MFALAVTFFITAFGIPPFHRTDDSDVYYKIFHQFTNEDKVSKFIKLHPATKPNKDFLLEQNHSSDPNAQELVSQTHHFIEMIMAMVNPNPTRRPQSMIELFETFEFMRPNPLLDISDNEARS